jgi:hypothetical protein
MPACRVLPGKQDSPPGEKRQYFSSNHPEKETKSVRKDNIDCTKQQAQDYQAAADPFRTGYFQGDLKVTNARTPDQIATKNRRNAWGRAI